MDECGLAATVLKDSKVTNKYGTGSDQNTKHYYAGLMKHKNKSKKKG